VNVLGVMPFFCISWKSAIVFSCCPTLSYLASLVFHENRSNFTVPGAIAPSFTSTHGGFLRSPIQSESCVVLCLKSSIVQSPSPTCIPTTAKDLKRIAARVSRFSGPLLLVHHFHPNYLQPLCCLKSLHVLTGATRR
jgi:hypothetical protein